MKAIRALLIAQRSSRHARARCLNQIRHLGLTSPDGVEVHCGLDDYALTRWPRFAPHAREVGFESVSAVPLRLRTETIGCPESLLHDSEPLSQEHQQIVQALADIATIGILQERAANDKSVVRAQPKAALESRVVIEQAKGILAERDAVDIDAAFERLRGYTRTHNRLLRQVAEEIIDGTLAIGTPT